MNRLQQVSKKCTPAEARSKIDRRVGQRRGAGCAFVIGRYFARAKVYELAANRTGMIPGALLYVYLGDFNRPPLFYDFLWR